MMKRHLFAACCTILLSVVSTFALDLIINPDTSLEPIDPPKLTYGFLQIHAIELGLNTFDHTYIGSGIAGELFIRDFFMIRLGGNYSYAGNDKGLWYEAALGLRLSKRKRAGVGTFFEFGAKKYDFSFDTLEDRDDYDLYDPYHRVGTYEDTIYYTGINMLAFSKNSYNNHISIYNFRFQCYLLIGLPKRTETHYRYYPVTDSSDILNTISYSDSTIFGGIIRININVLTMGIGYYDGLMFDTGLYVPLVLF